MNFLADFIVKEDKTRRMANLRRCLSKKDGQILWLCDTCVHRLDVIPDENTDEIRELQERTQNISLSENSAVMREIPA